METLQNSLPVLFRTIQPEILYDSLREQETMTRQEAVLSSRSVSQELFCRTAGSRYPSSSYEELQGIHALITQRIETGMPSVIPSVLLLLALSGRELLRKASPLACDFSRFLQWRELSLELGQDLFTTAFLAAEDLLANHPERTEFTWSAVLPTDNRQLNALIERGLAENHCHLAGTSQVFPLSWACVMNYPETAEQTQHMFRYNLMGYVSHGSAENTWPWERRLLWAAFLRMELFRELEGEGGDEKRFWMERNHLCPIRYVRQHVNALRFRYGAAVSGRPSFVLDYALRDCDCRRNEGMLQHPRRLLSGERSFLYRCFRACFDGTFQPMVQNWFYLYLLIKENFRAELVQVNRQPGFRNFKNYQDRKDIIYDSIAGYREEGLRLAVNGNRLDQNLVSFEARIAPKSNANAMSKKLQENRRILTDGASKKFPDGFFYVYHFIKAPEPVLSGKRLLLRPRNWKKREEFAAQAKALAWLLTHDRDAAREVYGVDAANIEIGCRPEAFATEFRYLRKLQPQRQRREKLRPAAVPCLHMTYHAGEDFLDISDGLRAIDEAVRFLGLRRGDRLGHALALGVDPEQHYAYKGNRVVLSKHDLLDNLVWLIYRSQELNLEARPKLQFQMSTQAEALFAELYRDLGDSRPTEARLRDYYCAMLLRGDAPELYLHLPYCCSAPLNSNSYSACRENPREVLRSYRSSRVITELYQRYHFDMLVREKGNRQTEFPVTAEYRALIHDIQDRLAEDLEQRGIMIESNPSSNYLIGTFRRYDAHPLLRLNSEGLCRPSGESVSSHQLSVSINTDDAGVFDTSLDNEYALMAAALECAKTPSGEPLYAKTSIYAYLENIRRMGLEQSFITA